MRAYVGVTDGEWYRFLAARPELDEVNFWRPSSGRRFRSLQHGEPFFFKTHYPHNRVVGGGFYSGFAALPVSEGSDIHTLYDRGYLGVDPRYRLRVSPRLRSDFGNGEELYRIDGKPITVPEPPRDRPHREFLERHLAEVFLTS